MIDVRVQGQKAEKYSKGSDFASSLIFIRMSQAIVYYPISSLNQNKKNESVMIKIEIFRRQLFV